MKQRFLMTACATAAGAALGNVHAQEAAAPAQAASQEQTVVVKGKRANRVSKGATGLPMEIKDTPQTISTIDKDEMADFGLTGSNEALALATGINVEQYETNRATFNARGFEIQLTQVDGLGMTNSWGTVVGREDTFLFERIELIRGANGLLTGVGNASGTINYVRKRPTNQDGGEVTLTGGSWGLKRVGLDYNKVLTEDGSWAARLVVAHEDKDSYLRDLHDKRTTVYGVVDGQIGDNGVLTMGITGVNAKQDSPMWGSLTLVRTDGTQVDLPVGTSTAQDWTDWNTKSFNGFVEYAHRLSPDWEAKATYNYRRGNEDTKLLYAYGALNDDNTGLYGWPYRSIGHTVGQVADVNLSGQFYAFGRQHSLLVGLNRSVERSASDVYLLAADCDATPTQAVLPAIPYGGDVVPEPDWGPRTTCSTGEQKLTRFYVASRLELTESLHAILGINAMHHWRAGESRYGSGGQLLDPNTKKLSPYLGFTYDFTPNVLGYVSYSDIFLPQEQADVKGDLLAPVKGTNAEAGVKAEWLDKRLLSTFAVFTSKEQGLATYAGMDGNQQSYYEAKDVKSKGFETEVTGRLNQDAKITLGYTHLTLTAPDGHGIYEWVPRNTVNFRFDSRVPMLPALRMGLGGRWQSDVSKIGSAEQPAYMVANAFAAYELNKDATLRLNINNLFDKKYIGGLAYGAIYGAPRNGALTLEYKL